MDIISYPSYTKNKYRINGRCVPLLIRLDIAGDEGLLVGKGSLSTGGLSRNVAENYERKGIVTLNRDKDGNITRAYGCQLCFDFLKG